MEKIEFLKAENSNNDFSGEELIDHTIMYPDTEADIVLPKEVEESISKKESEEGSKKSSKKSEVDLLDERVKKEESKEELEDFLNNLEESSETNESKESNEDFTDEISKLLDEGFIYEIPDELNPSEDEPVTLEQYKKIIEHNLPLIKENAVLEALSQFSDEIQKAILFEQQGGDVKDYLKVLSEVSNITSLDPTSKKDQISIIYEFYTDAGLDDNEIREKIEDLKEANLLEKEATKLKPKLDAKAQKIAEQKAEEQRQISEMKENADKYAANRITEKLVKGFETFKFNRTNATELFNKIMVEQNFNYGNKVQKKTAIEYLIDFHKYSETGSPERLIKALMILDPSGSYDEEIKKHYKNEATVNLINAKVAGTQKKYDTEKKDSNNTKHKEFKFKI